MSNNDVGKIFVGGLSWETSKETLRDYFSKYGEVVDSIVMMNSETGKPRGFGFVTFGDPSVVSLVLQSKPHELNGRMIDAKECTPKMAKNKKQGEGGGHGGGGGGGGGTKMFIGGLPPEISDDEIRMALSAFGRVSHINIMMDQATKKCRGFGFISFESEDSVQQACAQHFVNIKGKQVEMKRAEPRQQNQNQNNNFQGQNNGQQAMYGAGAYPDWSQGYNMQNNYQNYNPQAMMNSYAQGMAYNTAMNPATAMAAYAQVPTYQNYGGAYAAYAQQPAGGTAGYGTQQQGGYGQAQNYGASTNATEGSNYGAQSASSGGKGQQGYHPYRR